MECCLYHWKKVGWSKSFLIEVSPSKKIPSSKSLGPLSTGEISSYLLMLLQKPGYIKGIWEVLILYEESIHICLCMYISVYDVKILDFLLIYLSLLKVSELTWMYIYCINIYTHRHTHTHCF